MYRLEEKVERYYQHYKYYLGSLKDNTKFTLLNDEVQKVRLEQLRILQQFENKRVDFVTKDSVYLGSSRLL